MELSPVTIPSEKLKIWKIFRDVGFEGEEILKVAKLAHVANEKEAFVVTSSDETYTFLREDDGGCKITKIPELCHVQVEEFVTGPISLAITEDGRLFSWWNNFTHTTLRENDLSIYVQLGRPSVNPTSSIGRPEVVMHTKEEKVVQVALAEGRVVALTAGGDIYQWGACTDNWDSPNLIPKNAKFDNKELISVVCGFDGMTFALSEDGEIFQWKYDTDAVSVSGMRGTPVKKIAATKTHIYALTEEETMHVCDTVSEGNPVWPSYPKLTNIQDIAAFWEDVLVIEFKNGTRLAGESDMLLMTSLKCRSLDEYFAELYQKSYRTIGMPSRMRPVQKGTLGREISNLWKTKDDVDVTFSVEGKTITAHKLILKSRSDYFAKMFSNEWTETAGSKIEIKDTKFVTFEAFLFYLYHDKVTFSEYKYESIFDLMKLADSYCATNIARDCEKILMRGINTENAFFLVRNAASANALNLEGKVLKFILDNRVRLNLTKSSLPDLIEWMGQEALNKMALAMLRRY
ncbi:RCC1 and BTB domain-containing protein 1 isoform X2 [Folsomia candida]|uniref:RCC1 and BTB domain-containing protein 1 isoform X2 n=1 Tax=Folsomia candida TaxID=158441 RepID=UPI001605134A|nr:RCC1 and BTB domain-containing protein 1 isoform X2 [Folsomia candida]